MRNGVMFYSWMLVILFLAHCGNSIEKAIHDGYHNTYSFEFGRKKITLAPSKEPLKTPLVENSLSLTLLSIKKEKIKECHEGGKYCVYFV